MEVQSGIWLDLLAPVMYVGKHDPCCSVADAAGLKRIFRRALKTPRLLAHEISPESLLRLQLAHFHSVSHAKKNRLWLLFTHDVNV